MRCVGIGVAIRVYGARVAVGKESAAIDGIDVAVRDNAPYEKVAPDVVRAA